MKRLIIIFCFSLSAVDDKIIFEPLTESCINALNFCAQKCKNGPLTTAICTEKKECLNYCNFKLPKLMQPAGCYARCEAIKCPSRANCILDCFKKTPQGTCRIQCRKTTDECLTECDAFKLKEQFPCLNCCYNQQRFCEETCCA